MTTSGGTQTSSSAWRSLCRVLGWVQEAVAGWIGLLYPPRCLLCSRDLPRLEPLCSDCAARLAGLEDARCRRCGERLDDPRLDLCLRCGLRPFSIDRALFLGPYDGAWGALVRALKFDREPAIARDFGRRLASMLDASGLISQFDVVTFVPMTRADRRERGLNQAALLATRVARETGLPIRRTLRKVRRTRPQGLLSASDRRVNLRGAFRSLPSVRGRVLLVDDIVTTGSTVEECARVLRQSGAQSVTVLAVARA